VRVSGLSVARAWTNSFPGSAKKLKLRIIFGSAVTRGPIVAHVMHRQFGKEHTGAFEDRLGHSSQAGYVNTVGTISAPSTIR